MRLTAASLGAVIKYPRPSIVKDGSRFRKHGAFQDDLPLFRSVFATIGRRQLESGEFLRHPLAWLSEAADDICYVIIDLEDGCKSGGIALAEATEILDEISRPDRRSDHMPPDDRLAMARALAINQLVQQAAQVFRDHADTILDGSFQGSLIDQCPARDAYRRASVLVREKVFQSVRVLELEAAGYRAIQGLLQMLAEAALAQRPNRFQKHLLTLMALPIHSEMSPYQKLLACTDSVSGMTDRFCMEQFQKLTGHGPLT